MLRIAQISDCHLFAQVEKTSYGGIAPYQSLAKILSDIASQQIDILLVTGDLSADGSVESYLYFKELLLQNAINTHYIILPGNHDDLAILQKNFDSANLWSHYSLDAPLTIQNWQIHLLNTKTSGTGGNLSQLDLISLSASLQQHNDYFQIVAAHHHPLPSDSWMDAHGWDNGVELVGLLQKFNSVKAMIYGHIHAASQQMVAACCYLSCPSTCWQWAMQAEFGLSEQAPGYRILNLAESGNITTEIIRMEYP